MSILIYNKEYDASDVASMAMRLTSVGKKREAILRWVPERAKMQND